jgi:two-component system, OmpR family, alkaline phosphatase synthesis response regulator PhoP
MVDPTEPANILIADDDPNIVLSLEFLMRQAGYRVRVVQDGEAVLRAVAEEPPDLLLLDVMMPHRSGYDVCQTIRADPALNRVRIVMLTAKGRDVERTKGLALGADDYITKPFSTREVVARIREILDRPPRS